MKNIAPLPPPTHPLSAFDFYTGKKKKQKLDHIVELQIYGK